MEEYDLIIIGGGPAGITAGIYGGRANLRTLIIEKSVLGGQMLYTDGIENYPGFKKISGMDLTQQMLNTLSLFDVEREIFEINSIQPADGLWIVKSAKKQYLTKAVIVATGTFPRRLGVKGEAELLGRGVSFCAVCDGAFFEEKEIIVVGGGDSAVQEALFLTRFASRVTVVHRREELRAAGKLSEQAVKNPKIDFLWNSVISEIHGENEVKSVTIEDLITGKTKNVNASAVFIYVGNTPKIEMIKDYVVTSEDGFIFTDMEMRTSAKGIFAAGDIRVKPLRQICTAIGDGATAAIGATEYISSTWGS